MRKNSNSLNDSKSTQQSVEAKAKTAENEIESKTFNKKSPPTAKNINSTRGR